jgi:hypothetical protein
MIKLMDLLSEAIDIKTIQQTIDKELQFSINYKGSEGINRGWYKIEPVSISTEDGKDFLNAYIVDKNTKELSKEQFRFDISLIVGQNIPTVKAGFKSSLGDNIVDAVVNKRVVTIYYQGDKENAAGQRDIYPVCYGSTEGTLYLRAWQETGETFRGKLPKDDSQYRSMPGWRLFRVDRISSFKVKGNETFSEPGSGDEPFNPAGDHQIKEPVVIADFKPGKAPVVDEPTPPKGGPKKKQEPTKPDTTGGSTTLKPTGTDKPSKPTKPKTQHYASTRTKKPSDGKDKLKEQLRESQIIDSINDLIRIF